MRALRAHELPLRIHAQTLFEVRAILAELDGRDVELKMLNTFGLFKDRRSKNQTRRLLNERVQKLLNDLKRVTTA
jgi:hypothetical protein